jgi:hypothetical protein
MKQQNQQHTHNFYKANPNQISVSSNINYQIGTLSFTRYLDSAMTTPNTRATHHEQQTGHHTPSASSGPNEGQTPNANRKSPPSSRYQSRP